MFGEDKEIGNSPDRSLIWWLGRGCHGDMASVTLWSGKLGETFRDDPKIGKHFGVGLCSPGFDGRAREIPAADNTLTEEFFKFGRVVEIHGFQKAFLTGFGWV